MGSDLGGVIVVLAVCSWKPFDLRKKYLIHSPFCKSDEVVVNCDDDDNANNNTDSPRSLLFILYNAFCMHNIT